MVVRIVHHDCRRQARVLFLAFSLRMAPFGLASVAIAEEKAVGKVGGDAASVAGRVTLTAADGATFPAAGVRLILNCEPEGITRVEISDERGTFRFESVRAEGCTMVTDLQGFRSGEDPDQGRGCGRSSVSPPD